MQALTIGSSYYRIIQVHVQLDANYYVGKQRVRLSRIPGGLSIRPNSLYQPSLLRLTLDVGYKFFDANEKEFAECSIVSQGLFEIVDKSELDNWVKVPREAIQPQATALYNWSIEELASILRKGGFGPTFSFPPDENAAKDLAPSEEAD